MPEKGHVQAESGVDISFSTGSIGDIVDAADSLEKTADERALTDTEKRTVLKGGASLAINPPAVIPHAGVAYAPLDGWELGLRFATSGWRAGARRQILKQEQSGIDLALGLGFGRSIFDPPIDSVLEKLRVDDFERWNFDLPVAIGRHGSWYRWWGGPRLAYSRASQTMTLMLSNNEEVVGAVSGHAFYLGGYAGVALGFESVFVGPEITLVQLLGDAEVTALNSTSSVEINSFVVYPAFAVMGEF